MRSATIVDHPLPPELARLSEMTQLALKSQASALVVILIALGCSKPPSESAVAPIAVQPAAAVAPAVLSIEAGSALVARWVDAQNRQSFEEYEGLYAQRFYGIKRAGETTTHFDRKGWLRDRKGMFARPFQVTVEGLQLRVLAQTVVAEFEQSFKSQSYADKGPKQLVMIVEGDALKIAREELLRSGRTRDPRWALGSAEFSFIREVGDRRYWIASDAGPGGQTIAGPPERVGTAAAFAKLSDAATLPESLQALVGAKIAVEPGQQPACSAELREWGVLAEIEPHFEAYRRWSGEEYTEAQIAREIFGPDVVSGRDHHFVVDVTEATRSCASAKWGRLQSLGEVELYRLETHEQADAALHAAVQKTRGYKELERNFRESESEGSIAELMSEGLTVYETRLGSSTHLLSTFIHAGECQSFSGQLNQVWRMRRGKPVELQSVLPSTIRPELAVDLNRDGFPEWITETQVIAWDGHEYTIAVDVTPNDYDCSC